MTREEYENLVKTSVSFKKMSPDLQISVLSARGEAMRQYVEIFEEERKLMTEAIKEFENNVDKIVFDYKSEVQKSKKNKLAAAESSAQKHDEKNIENLLNKL